MKKALVYILFLVFITSCTEDRKTITQIFNEKIANYTHIKLPQNFDPNKEPNYREEVFMTDSLFIINFIDKHQFDEDAGDRTYGYYEGTIIFENENSIGILYLFGFSVGYEYRLYTYSKEEPQIIDSLKISEFASDYSRTYGKISDNLTIWRKTDFLDWDETTEKDFVKKSIEETFRINEQGIIQRTSQNIIEEN